MTNTTQFSTSIGKRTIKSESNMRVSKPAANKILRVTEEYCEEIAETAIQIAENQGRETVRREDIRQALRQHR
ncbi:NFYB/HAP3 family transcription factor subunit [Halobacteria archaeon AArc-curdl1]|uniref:NFYB/HAP3 family transcription factor subunit n=1 Tax=Natronosalvus hydrolyticus TaxID=2979988 RepID=A0AAP2ZAA7_9EURY|nr:NFYB/HAP3 family transcription factor subunit [Halobacteria archaeon AArc-curdl1]